MDFYFLPEILVHVFSLIVDPPTLFTVRLVCSAWKVLVDVQIDKIPYISLSNREHLSHFSTYFDQGARDKVSSLILNVPDRDYWSVRGSLGPQILLTHEFYPTYCEMARMAERLIPQFINLQHISIHFRPVPRAVGPFACSEVYKSNFLLHLMDYIFKILEKLERLDELALECLPVQAAFPLFGPPDSFTLPEVTGVIEQLKLKTLKLAFVGTDVWPPINPNLRGQETIEHYDSFGWPEVWVHHAKDTLRHLTLTCWGFYMRDIPKESPWGYITIPHLESLELGSIAFTNDAPLEWILSHAPTLRSLVFQDCAIVYSMELRTPCPDESANAEIPGQRHYHRHWDKWFKDFQASLHELEHFGFGSRRVRAPGEEGPVFASERRNGPAFWGRGKLLFGLFPDRYIAMAVGIEDCPWILRPPRTQHPCVPTNGQRDHIALRSLMRSLGLEFKETDDSTHAAYVDRLSGVVRCVEVAEAEEG